MRDAIPVRFIIITFRYFSAGSMPVQMLTTQVSRAVSEKVYMTKHVEKARGGRGSLAPSPGQQPGRHPHRRDEIHE